MKTLRDIMRSGFLFTVQKEATVSEAVRLMADHNVGIVIVLDGTKLVGVLSERDVIRRVLHQGRVPASTAIGEVMTGCVITADADMDYESAMRAMDDAGIRHLLVTSGARMLSMISIRDLMRAVIHDKHEEVQHLREYLYQVPAGSPGASAAKALARRGLPPNRRPTDETCAAAARSGTPRSGSSTRPTPSERRSLDSRRGCTGCNRALRKYAGPPLHTCCMPET
jgi:CBS domain-containing protein